MKRKGYWFLLIALIALINTLYIVSVAIDPNIPNIERAIAVITIPFGLSGFLVFMLIFYNSLIAKD